MASAYQGVVSAQTNNSVNFRSMCTNEVSKPWLESVNSSCEQNLVHEPSLQGAASTAEETNGSELYSRGQSTKYYHKSLIAVNPYAEIINHELSFAHKMSLQTLWFCVSNGIRCFYSPEFRAEL